MKGLRVLAVLVLALLIGSAAQSGAEATAELVSAPGTWETTYVGSNPIFQWTSTACWPECEAEIAIEFNGTAGGGDWFALAGEPDQDPTVTQTVLNNSAVNWLDWHVDILHGVIDWTAPPVVHKVEANAANWTIGHVFNAGYTDGFGAVYNSANQIVTPGQHLYIKFKWIPDGSGLPVTIHQYPTEDGEFIPEPSGLLALAGGMGSLFAFYRRRK